MAIAANVRGEYMIDDVEPGECRVLASAAAANRGTSAKPADGTLTFAGVEARLYNLFARGPESGTSAVAFQPVEHVSELLYLIGRLGTVGHGSTPAG